MTAVYTDVNLAQLGNDPPESVRRSTPEGPEAPADAGASGLEPEDFTGKGYLLEEQDDTKVFKAIDEEVVAQEPLAKNREAARKWAAAVRRGEQFATLEKDEDRAVWKYVEPPGEGRPNPIPNKADDLCRKIVSQVIVDLPLPDPKPATDSEQDRGSADIAKRFLKVDGDESGTNDAELFRDILDSAMTDASEFAHVWTDMKGGGWRPLRIQAHPQAQDASDPLVAMEPVVNPLTGQPALDEMQQPVMKEIPTADYVFRFVTAAQQFTENPAEAARQWVPRIMRDVLGPQHVRTVPEMADVANAEGVVLLMVGPISDLKRRVPELAEWDDAQLAKLTEWKPRRPRVLVPSSMRSRLKAQADKKDGLKADDNTLVFWYQKYCSPGPDYVDGAEIIVSGVDQGLVLKKATLRKDLPAKDDQEARVLLRDIPVSQCKALHDSETRDPFGKRPLELFGATNEGLANLYGSVLEDTTNRLNPLTFIPSTSPVQAWQMTQRGSREPIYVYSKDDMPMSEEFADLATYTPQVIEMLESSMRETAGLGSAAEMLNTPQAVSGEAKKVELGQTKVSLAPIAQNFFAFVKRYWRLKLEAAQANLTLPQQVEYVGIDQAYKAKWFTGADFAGVKDVAIMTGSGTMMTGVEKQNYLQGQQANGWVDPDEAAEVGRSMAADDLGMRASPHEDTIKRELAKWTEGPPEETADPATGQPPIGPATGAPKPTWQQQAQAYSAEQQQLQQSAQQGADPATLQPQAPAPWSPFVPRPTDEDPNVAKRQYKILRDFIASTDYSKQIPEWRALVDQRYAQAMYAAGVQTIKQQAEAAQAQQEQQANDKDADRSLKREEGAANRQAKTQPQGALAA